MGETPPYAATTYGGPITLAQSQSSLSSAPPFSCFKLGDSRIAEPVFAGVPPKTCAAPSEILVGRNLAI
jgi:hypothetical protein